MRKLKVSATARINKLKEMKEEERKLEQEVLGRTTYLLSFHCNNSF
jgi:hypothetical protein